MNISTRDAFVAGMFVIIGAIINPLVAFMLQSQDTLPSIVDFDPDVPSPQPHDKSITWTVNARDMDNDRLYYKFQLKGPSSTNKWTTQQDWSQTDYWIWNPKPEDTGNYTIRAIVRDNKHSLSDMGDVNTLPYEYIITKSSKDWQIEAKYRDEMGDFIGARQAYENALKIAQQNATFLNNLGVELYLHDMDTEALKAFDTALKLNKTDPSIWINRGDLLYSLRKYSEALKSFEKAKEIYPQDAEIWYRIGNTLKLIGHPSEAKDAIAKATILEADVINRQI